MANDEMKQIWKVPEPTLRRLPWYLAFLKLMKGRGEAFVSSTQIAKEINVDPSQVAKDLSFVNISGKTRVGYEISTLVDVLEDFLGFTAQHKAFRSETIRIGDCWRLRCPSGIGRNRD